MLMNYYVDVWLVPGVLGCCWLGLKRDISVHQFSWETCFDLTI